MKKLVQITCIVLLTLLFSGPVLAETIQGQILEVKPAELQAFEEEVWENQIVTIRLLSGPERGDTIQILHTLTGHPYFDLRVQPGDRVILETDHSGDEAEYFLTDFSRRNPLMIITILFILAVVVIGGVQGIKAILSLVGMGFVIIKMILPLVFKGYNPIIVTVGLSSILTMLFVFFIAGRSKKALAAICGTVGGLIVAGILALVVGKASYLTGLSSEEAQMLQYIESSIDFQGLLFSGIIIGALGAILDVGISISSSMEQIKAADPTTDFKTLFTRGILVGRDMIATMSNTLILAYVGSSLPLLLLFQASQSSWGEVLNMDLVASEVVRSMAGSIGLTLAIPITAFISALLFVESEHKAENLGD